MRAAELLLMLERQTGGVWKGVPVSVTKGRSGVSGILTTNGRLTRGGMLFLRGFGLFLLLGVGGEWRALSTVAFGERLPGKVTRYVQIASERRRYQVRVAFLSGRQPVEIDRALRQGRRSAPRLAEGDGVDVAYWPAAPHRAVLMHPHENWRGAPVAAILGVVLVWLSWFWAPRTRDTAAGAVSAAPR